MMDQYVIAVQNVFQNDAVLAVNPMTFPVYTPSQIIGTFNAVAYQKCKYFIHIFYTVKLDSPAVSALGVRSRKLSNALNSQSWNE
jgi:hypothetical protein